MLNFEEHPLNAAEARVLGESCMAARPEWLSRD